jgi:hypothetical protein
MNSDFTRIVGIIVIIAFIIYLVTNSLKLQINVMEGLTNPPVKSKSKSESGIGASAGNYATSLQNTVTKLNSDILLLNNKDYKKEYENIILHMDDYINALMLKTVLSTNINSENVSDNIDIFKRLSELNSAKAALNNVMKYVDSN